MLGYVIGDGDMVTGFRLVGLDGVEVTSSDQAWQEINKALSRVDLAFIVISEDFSSQPHMQETIDGARLEQRNPLIIELPGSRGKKSQTRMSDLISKILGVKL